MTNPTLSAAATSHSMRRIALLGTLLLLLSIIQKLSTVKSDNWVAPLVTAIAVTNVFLWHMVTKQVATRALALSRHLIVLYVPLLVIATYFAANVTGFIVVKTLFALPGYDSPIWQRTFDDWVFRIAMAEALGVVRLWFATAYLLFAYFWLRSTPHTVTRRVVAALTGVVTVGLALAMVWRTG